jgi:SpoVK/Ycf46/Vps4 family AAA+-type ATPase
VFDNPPELYFHYKKNYGEELAKTALHVIVLDEFDAISRTRGGAGGEGDQGDAGVARDSVVNQLLAKMDGVDDLGVPTLLIGLTNKPSLIDPALMRPGRFEVQINVPKPKTVAQRVAILKVHMENMIKSGRVLVRDCPEGTPAWKRLQSEGDEGIPSFDELLDLIAVECDGMSGASLAGVSRAAASRALERAVTDFAGTVAQESMFGSEDDNGQNSIANCLVTFEDFERAVEDVFESAKGGDYVEPSKTEVKSGAEIRAERNNNLNQGEFQNLKTLLPTRKITKDTWRQ